MPPFLHILFQVTHGKMYYTRNGEIFMIYPQYLLIQFRKLTFKKPKEHQGHLVGNIKTQRKKFKAESENNWWNRIKKGRPPISRARVFNQRWLPSLNSVFWPGKLSNRENNMSTLALTNWEVNKKELSESSSRTSPSSAGRRQQANEMSESSEIQTWDPKIWARGADWWTLGWLTRVHTTWYRGLQLKMTRRQITSVTPIP